PPMSMEDADALRLGVVHAEHVVAQDGTLGPVRYRAKVMKAVRVMGKGPGYEGIDDVTIESGRQLTELDDQRRRMVCVIGPELVDELFPHQDALGREIRIGPETYQVVGVTVAKGKL